MRAMRFLSLIFFASLAASAQNAEIATGLPLLKHASVARPSGAVGGLKVLDWAGFKSAVTYTFDDALDSQIKNYPLLHATGAPMTYFLTSGNIHTAEWGRMAKDGNELANHTTHHCRADATACGWGAFAGTLVAEYDACNAFILANYGVEVRTTASPYGDTGYDEAAKQRFFLNRGVWGGVVLPGDNSDPFNLPVFAVQAGDTAAKFNPAIDGAHDKGAWLIFLFHSMSGDGGYAPVKADDVVASVKHAQSLENVWIDTMAHVGAYWIGQRLVSTAQQTKSAEKTVYSWKLPEHFPPHQFVRITLTGGTITQQGKELAWNAAGYYEVALDAGELTIQK